MAKTHRPVRPWWSWKRLPRPPRRYYDSTQDTFVTVVSGDVGVMPNAQHLAPLIDPYDNDEAVAYYWSAGMNLFNWSANG